MTNPEVPQINMSSIRVAGVGGLGMIAVIVTIAFVMPVVRWFVLVSVAGGVIGGLAFIAYHRWLKPDPPHGPTLMVDKPEASSPRRDSAGTHRSSKLSRVALVK